METPVASPRELRAAFVAKLYMAMQHGARPARMLLDRQRKILRRRLSQEKTARREDLVNAALGVRSAQTKAVLEYLDDLERAWLPRRPRSKPARSARRVV